MKNGEVQEPTGACFNIYRNGGSDCILNALREYDRVFDDESVGRERNNIKIIAWYGYYIAVPRYYEPPKGWNGPMYGGNFIHRSDSSLAEKYPYPIKLHDRYENP